MSLFAEVFDKTKAKKQEQVRLSVSSEIFPKQDFVNPFREWSILAVRIGKFEPLRARAPIRKLLFSADQFSHIIKDSRDKRTPKCPCVNRLKLSHFRESLTCITAKNDCVGDSCVNSLTADYL